MLIASVWFWERELQSMGNYELIVMSHIKYEGMTMMDAGTRLVAAGNADRVVRQRPGFFCRSVGNLGEELACPSYLLHLTAWRSRSD